MIFVKGEFSEGLMHGSGRYMWADGVVYEVILNIFTHLIYVFCITSFLQCCCV